MCVCVYFVLQILFDKSNILTLFSILSTLLYYYSIIIIISAYGRDMSPKRRFSDLIRTAGSVPGLDRLRFVTSHPRYMSMGVIDAVAETPTACKAFHVPFQSGSNTILEAMGRGHTREKYLTIVDRIRTVCTTIDENELVCSCCLTNKTILANSLLSYTIFIIHSFTNSAFPMPPLLPMSLLDFQEKLIKTFKIPSI